MSETEVPATATAAPAATAAAATPTAASTPASTTTSATPAAAAPRAQERLGRSDWWIYRPPSNGRPYYFNAKTQVTSWTRPVGDDIPPADAAPATAAPAAAAAAAAAVSTPASQPATASSATTEAAAKPAAAAAAATASAATKTETAAAVAGAPATAPPPPSREAIADAWRQYATPEGRLYFHNPLTRATVWQRPPEMAPPPHIITARIRFPEDRARFVKGVLAELGRRSAAVNAAKAAKAAATEQARIDDIHKSRARRASAKAAVAERAAATAAAALARRVAIMGAAGDPATAAQYGTARDAELAFAAMLEERVGGADLAWPAALLRIARDPRFGALVTPRARREAYSRFLASAADRRAARDAAAEREHVTALSAAVAGEGPLALALPPKPRWSAERDAVLALPPAAALRSLWAAAEARARRGPGEAPGARDYDEAEDRLRGLFYRVVDEQDRRRADEEKQRRRAVFSAFEDLLYEHSLLKRKPAAVTSPEAAATLHDELAAACAAQAAAGAAAQPPLVFPGAVWRTALTDARLTGDARFAAVESDQERLALFDVVAAALADAEAEAARHAEAADAAKTAAAEDAFVAALDAMSAGAATAFAALAPAAVASAAPAYAPAAGDPAWLRALFTARYGAVPPSLYPLTPIAPPAFVFSHTAAAASPELSALRALLTRPVPRFSGTEAPLLEGAALDARLDALVDRWSAGVKARLQGARRLFAGMLAEAGPSAAVALDGDFHADFEARWASDPRYSAAATTATSSGSGGGAMTDDDHNNGGSASVLSRADAWLLFATEKDRVLFAARRCWLREVDARADLADLLVKSITLGYIREKLARREAEYGRDARNRPLDSASGSTGDSAAKEPAATPFSFVMSPQECLPYGEALGKLDWRWPDHLGQLRRDLGAQAGRSEAVLDAVLGEAGLEEGRQKVYYAFLTEILRRVDDERVAAEKNSSSSSSSSKSKGASDGASDSASGSGSAGGRKRGAPSEREDGDDAGADGGEDGDVEARRTRSRR